MQGWVHKALGVSNFDAASSGLTRGVSTWLRCERAAMVLPCTAAGAQLTARSDQVTKKLIDWQGSRAGAERTSIKALHGNDHSS